VVTESFANKASDGGDALLAECILGGSLDRVECAIEGVASGVGKFESRIFIGGGQLLQRALELGERGVHGMGAIRVVGETIPEIDLLLQEPRWLRLRGSTAMQGLSRERCEGIVDSCLQGLSFVYLFPNEGKKQIFPLPCAEALLS
jgi:hypothetical protein